MNNSLYSPMSFWFLNHDLEDGELRWQLQEMKDKGFKGVFIHPRDGLTVPYQSERWWGKVGTILEACEELGLHAWLYDEDPFPSGAAGGQVFFDRPEFKAREVTMETAETEGGPVRISFPMGRLLKVVAIRVEQDGLSREWLDLTVHTGILRSDWKPGYMEHSHYYPPYEDFGIPHWRSMATNPHYALDGAVPEGRWKICAFIERDIEDVPWGHYTDLLNPEAVRYFLDLTHEKYASRFGSHFGRLIPGIFTDEPKVKGVVSWTDGFAGYFRSLFGYDVRDRLPDLFLWIDDETAQVRHDYRLALGRLFRDSFVVPIADWCRERGLISTGHISPEEDPVGQTRYTPYLLSMLKRFEFPGTDLIAGHIGGLDFPLLHLGPKLASSAAHHEDRFGVMGEAFGANGWDLDFRQMRKMADWLFVMGVTDIVTHGQFYSIDGLRKKEAPPSLFYQSSHWPYFSAFSQYLSEMSVLLKEGVHRCHLLVYYPQAAFSVYYPDRVQDLERSAAAFGRVVHELLSSQWDFDLADEETLGRMSVKDGKLQGVKEDYDVLVLAGCDYLESGAAAYCRQFVSQGGKVWLVGKEPVLLQSEKETVRPPGVSETAAPYYSHATGPDRIVADLEKEIIRNTVIVDGRTSSDPMKDLYVNERQLGDRIRLFIVNAAEEWREGFVRSADVSFVLPPHGSLMFDINEDHIAYPLGAETAALNEAAGREIFFERKESPAPDAAEALDLSDGWTLKPLNSNVLNLSHWHLWDEDPRPKGKAITSVQAFPVLDMASPLLTNEFWAFSRFYTQGRVKRTSLVFDRSAWEGECRITVNGSPVPEAAEVRRYDVHNLEIDIADFLKPGEGRTELNWVELHFPSGGRLLEPFRLYGDFRADISYNGLPPGKIRYGSTSTESKALPSWEEIGFPHYAGTMIYEKEVLLPESWLRADPADGGIFLLAESVRDVARLTVNGAEAGTRYCHPYAWELDALLKPGLNRLRLEVANSPVTLFEGNVKKSGMLGSVKLLKLFPDNGEGA